jgi:cathepsin D
LENVIPKPVFAFYLSSDHSELHLGGTDKDFYIGDIEYHRVYKDTIRGFDYPFYWFIPGGQINVNNEKGLILGVHAAVDIRTAFIRGPREEVNAIYASMGVEHRKIHDFHAFPCDKVPTVSFQWGNKKWVITPEK